MQTSTKTKGHAPELSSIRTEAPVICQTFSSTGGSHAADGVMRSYSSQESYIETTHPFKAGTILMVRMDGYPARSRSAIDQEGPRSIGLAEVKWQRPVQDADDIRYGIGLKYLE